MAKTKHKKVAGGDGKASPIKINSNRARGNEVFTDYNPFIGRGRGLVHIANMDFCLSIDGATNGRDGLRAIIQAMTNAKGDKIVVYKPANIEICFFPAFAKKILEQLDDVIEAKS